MWDLRLSAKELILWIVLLEKTLESPLGLQGYKLVNAKGNQAWIFIGRTDEVLILQPLMWRANSLEKTLMLGKMECKRRGRKRMRWLDSMTDSMTWIWANSGRYWKTEEHRQLQSMGSQRVGYNLVTQQQQQQINEFVKPAEYKINTQKSLVFLYTSNERLETEIKETIPLPFQQKE